MRILGRWFRGAERALGRLARHRALSILLVGFLSFITSAALSLLVRMPQPHIADEFSYLLAADTFAHGRLTNPTHPLWVHFETRHVIHQPTYASKYPPGQGLALAAGQVIGGHPIVGVWLSTALACAAIGWMLMAWLPPRWALLGGLLAVLHPLFLDWSQSYWGGSVAAFGGALVLGALRRIAARQRVRDALLMGLGMAILANSRPYEGLVLSLLSLGALLVGMVRWKGPAVRVSLKRVVLPLLIVLTPTAGAMGLYNWRVTGNVLLMPFVAHEAAYVVAPVFLWQKPRPIPSYRHKEIKDFTFKIALPFYMQQKTSNGLLGARLATTWFLVRGFFPFGAILIPLVTMPRVLRDRWVRLALLMGCAFSVVLLSTETVTFRHYAAPAVGLAFILEVQALRHLRLWRWDRRPIGQWIFRACLVLSIASVVPWCASQSRIDRTPEWRAQISQRMRILTRLKQVDGRHLVIVRYAPDHNPAAEWVYNEANIDGAKVVWAREMDTAHNRKLLDYFKGRRVWLLEPDAKPPKLVPYTEKIADRHGFWGVRSC